ncbi:unnamed protein product, partial [Closterium sp. NIES-53]
PLGRNPSVHSNFRFRHIQAYCDYNNCGTYPTSPPLPDESPEASSAGARGAGAVGAGEAGAAAAVRVAAEGAATAAAVAAAAATAAALAAVASTCDLTFPPPDSSPAVFSPPRSRSSPPVVQHDWTVRCPARAHPSSSLDDLRTVLLRSSPHPSLPQSVLLSPLESSLTASTSTPITDYYDSTRPNVTPVLASLETDPRASPSSISALTAAVADFATTHRLDYAT